jgi:DNA-binding beta-propeller fold protein YncE
MHPSCVWLNWFFELFSTLRKPTVHPKQSVIESMSSISFDNSFRSDHGSSGQLSPPSGFAFTTQGHLILSDDFNHRIQVYDNDRLLVSFGEKGKESSQLNYPKGIAVDKYDNIYVADSWNHRVQKFDLLGNHIETFGSYGEGEGELNEPYDIMVEDCGNILVVERYNHRIQWFSPEGKSLGWIGQRGTVLEEHLAYLYETSANLFSTPAFEFPTSIGTDSLGNYFITDSGNHRIAKFNKNWRRVLTFGERGEETGQFQYPLCVSIGRNDLLYVSDLNNNRIQIFSPFGQFLDSLEQIDDSTPLKAPCLTAIDSHGKLYAGLTFNPSVFRFSTPSHSLESLAGDRVQSDSKNPEWPTLKGQLAEQSAEYLRATENYAKAIELMRSETNRDRSIKIFNANLLLNLSHITLKEHSSSKNETALLGGLEIFIRQLKYSREKIQKTYEAWEEVAREFSEKEFKKNLEILEDREDPRVFNQELFNIEKQTKILFREIRAASYKHCKLSDQLAEYVSSIIASPSSAILIQRGGDNLVERLNELGEIFSTKLAIKEANELEMIEAFSALQEDQSKWNIFLTNFIANNRIVLLLTPLLFELRTLLITLKCSAQASTGKQKISTILTTVIERSPINQVVPKILLGIQEIRPAHTIIDTLWRDLIDTWVALQEENKKPLVRKLEPDYFSPVPFDIEDLNIEEIINSHNSENTKIEIKSKQLIIGNSAYYVDSFPDNFLQKISQILESQTNYDAKNNELQAQLKDLHKQCRDLSQQLKHVNPQDKRTPISIDNNISAVNFQISLLKRMVLTLEVNEDRNINRLVTGSALLASNKEASQESSTSSFYKNLSNYHSQEKTHVDCIAKEIKKTSFRFSDLEQQLLNLNLEQSIENVDHSIQLENEREEIKNDLEDLKFNLLRRSRTCNRLDRLFDFLRQANAHNKESSVFGLVPAISHSLTPMGRAIGTLVQPMGLAFDSSGNIFYVDQENHHVSQMSQFGICLARFGGWGNSPGKFQYPVSLQLDRQDNVYVVDMNNQRIQKFLPNGEFLLAFGNCDKEGQRLGKVFSSSIDKEDNLWVADTSHHRIQVFDSNGKLINSIYPKDLNHPVGICCLENAEYLIADQSDDLIKRYDVDGNLLASVNRKKTGFGDLYITTFNPKYGIFASDHWSSRILHLDSSLNIQGIYGNSGNRLGQFNRVGWMDTRNDLLAVADMCNNRIQVFDIKKTLSS